MPRRAAFPAADTEAQTMKTTAILGAALAMLGGGAAMAADAPKAFRATLAGHAVLPARTLMPAPADAPAALQISGKFSGQMPVRLTGEASDGAAAPYKGQPVQGFSGIRSLGDGRFLVLTDNGFGARGNSPDSMLFFHHVRPDFATGTVAVEKTTFLSDPNRVVPFVIGMEGTDTRYLTGADFDTEGFQTVGETILIGDEFGPYVLAANLADGVVTALHETVVDGVAIRSPQHYAISAPNPDGKPAANLKRSTGFEGFAKSADGKTLLPMLEGPIFRDGAYEKVDGVEALRIIEMDAASRAWTGRSWLYRLEADGHAIGDFQMIDATRGLVIERDNNQGDAELACKDGATEGCFKAPALFKRVYLIDFAGVEPGQAVRKVAMIDLLDIADPQGVARQGKRADGRFTFPFQTIENVDRVDATRIIVANDNNFPFSKGRSATEIDDNEFVLLEVGDFLNAR
jgi:hypothetical protein